MPELTTERSVLFDADKGTRMYVGQVTFSPEEWKKMTKKEKAHAKNCATVSFKSLVWYAQEMRDTGCTYKQAVINVNRRSDS